MSVLSNALFRLATIAVYAYITSPVEAVKKADSPLLITADPK
jgi:hypothetical protein